MRNRNFVFTYNNYPDTKLVDELDCKFIAYSKEVAPTTGTPHLQGYVSFHSAKSFSAACKLLPKCRLAIMAGSFAENEAYCAKAATLVKRGEEPVTNDNKGRAEKLRWQRARNLAKEGNLDDIDADIYIRCYSTLKNIKKDHQKKPLPKDVKCYWIFGATGTGKSHAVETQYPLCFKKCMDDLKWFDNYQGEDVCYLEDIDKYQVKWGGLLKRLADRWPMQASIKGTMAYIRPACVIVTSNYRIEDIWSDPETLDPLLRRFEQVEKVSQEQHLDLSYPI